MSGEPVAAAALVAAVPVLAPVGRAERGRVSAATVRPGHALPDKVVVDFGWRAVDAHLDLEITVRRRESGTPPEQRWLRAFCAERDVMQRCTAGAADWAAPAPAADAAWSERSLTVDGTAHPFTVLRTAHSWVAAAVLDADWLVRLFAPAEPAGLTALRRVTDPADLEPLRGRG
ncbi:hypothetical protein NI17_003675 [Thermobifida halotolerans]|uniref:Uncharacterized protein n=1 Tax=Thermobifida halotolerans TaxID=483545 RepID=A0A399G7F4_9ACTN|nr:hypothetical protein [Thermobifida halotolerans]UOE20349.1 hypothetical protein NI17_003675 [Thermobifida halotolerans]